MSKTQSKLNETVKVLVHCHNDKMREINNLKRAADRAGLCDGLYESEASSLFGDHSYDGDMRVRLKANKPNKKSQRDHPALAHQVGRARSGDD